LTLSVSCGHGYEADRIGFDVACRVLGLREFAGIGANVTMYGIGLIERTLYRSKSRPQGLTCGFVRRRRRLSWSR
jgi:hypothetical protein